MYIGRSMECSGKRSATGLVARNVAALVDAPRVPTKRVETITPEQAKLFLQMAESDRYYALFYLAFSTAIRRGEALALEWRNVDIDSASPSIRIEATLTRTPDGFVMQEPKTERSRRTIPLSPDMVPVLRRHRAAQAAEALSLGAVWDRTWDLVFCTEIGTPVEATNMIRRSFRPVAMRSGLPEWFTFHSMRHAAASFALAAGVNPVTVAELLGHSGSAMVLQRYGHAIPGSQSLASAAIARALGK